MSDIALSPFYHSSVNEITQPDKFAAHSHYLTRRWKRELGPTGYVILTSLRDRCFYNRKTGELRNSIQVTMTEIAEECGISERTVRRELDTNKVLQKFVRAQREFEPDKRRGGFRFGANSFQVAMDDPIHPQDEAELLEIVRRKAEEAEKGNESPLERARRRATFGQSDRTQGNRSDNLANPSDNLTGATDNLSDLTGQIDRTLNIPDSSLPKYTFPYAAEAASEFSLSLFPESSETTKRWDDLTQIERAPFVATAERELKAIYPERAANLNRRLVDVRAKNLFEQAAKSP